MRPRRRPPASAASASSNEVLAIREASSASRTRNRGSRPAATGWVASRRRQNPWIVVIGAASPARAASCSRVRPARIAGGRGPAGELDPDATAHLRRRLLGEGEGEDPLRLDRRRRRPPRSSARPARASCRFPRPPRGRRRGRGCRSRLLLLGRCPARLARGRRLPFGRGRRRCRRRRILGRRGLEAELLGAVHQHLVLVLVLVGARGSRARPGRSERTRTRSGRSRPAGCDRSRPARISPTTRVASGERLLEDLLESPPASMKSVPYVGRRLAGISVALVLLVEQPARPVLLASPPSGL